MAFLSLCAQSVLSERLYLNNVGAMSLGYSSASVLSYLNPASLSLDRYSAAGISYRNCYGVKELSSATVFYQQPTKFIDFTVIGDYFGYEYFNEIQCGLNVSKLLSSSFSLGLRILYYRLDYIDNEDYKGAVSADVGFQYRIVDNFLIGALIRNPLRVKYSNAGYDYYLPVVMTIGINMLLTHNFRSIVEVEKDTRLPVSFKLGMEYSPFNNLSLRCGVLTSPLIPTYGLGYVIKKMTVDFAGNWHPDLGISSSIGISFRF